jgi:uncharacterized membrane protein YebE (DUF533 family)
VKHSYVTTVPDRGVPIGPRAGWPGWGWIEEAPMLEPKKLLDELMGARIPGTESTVGQTAERAGQLARDNPLATGALAAILLGTGAGRALTGSALRIGGLAAIAGLAYQAYRSYQNGGTPAEAAPADGPGLLAAPEDTAFHPSRAPQGEDAFALTLVRAMIAAARADGSIDAAERAKIAERLGASELGGDVEAFLNEELARPVDMDELVAAAQTDAQKVALYTASRLAVDLDSRAEQGYLDMLAGRLKLPQALVGQVEATVSALRA